MRMRKKKWVAPFLQEESHYLLADPSFIMNIKQPIILEIGMGMGDFLVEMAKDNSAYFFIGLEKDETCIARAIKKAISLEVDNIRFIKEDASNLLHWFSKSAVSKIYLQFSDPWPKKQHAKRRLTSINFLKLYYAVLKHNGLLIFKTDQRKFFEYSLLSFENTPFRLIDISLDYHSDYETKIITAYESRFMAENKPIYYICYEKGAIDEETD